MPQKPTSFIPDSFVPDIPKPSSFVPDSFIPDAQPKQQSFWEKLTTPDVTVNIPDNVTGWKRVPGEFYNKFIGPMTSPLGAAATVGTAALGGPLMSAFPTAARALGLGFGGYNAQAGIGDIQNMMQEGVNPSNALDLMGHGLGSLALPLSMRGAAAKPKASAFQALNAKPEVKALPAKGETGIGTNVGPRFYAGERGTTDAADLFPYVNQFMMRNSAPKFKDGPKGILAGSITAKQPAIVNRNIGAELGNEYTVPFGNMRANQITHPPGQTNPRVVNPNTAAEMPRASNVVNPVVQAGLETGKPMSKSTQIIGAAKALKASLDFSAPLRQGRGLIHKKEWRDSIVPMFKSWTNEKSYDDLMGGIQSRPTFATGQNAGLSITDAKSLSNREDMFVSNLLNKWVPGLERSNRAYSGFLNKLRQDTFDNLLQDAKVLDPKIEANIPKLQGIATYVNNMTGRGSLNFSNKKTSALNLEKNAELLNNIFFSPRYMAATIQRMRPSTYISASPQIRKEYLKSYLAMAGLGATSLGLGYIGMDGDVNMSDPSDSDYMKLKVGNTRIDPWGGDQQLFTAANRIMDFAKNGVLGGKNNEYGAFRKPTAKDSLERYFSNKLNPVMRFGYELANGRQMSGLPLSAQSAVINTFVPMIVEDVYKLAGEGDPRLLGLIPPLAFGMGVQTYDKR